MPKVVISKKEWEKIRRGKAYADRLRAMHRLVEEQNFDIMLKNGGREENLGDTIRELCEKLES